MKKTPEPGSELTLCLAKNHSEIRRCAVCNVSKSLLPGAEVKRFGFEKIHLSRISERYWRQGGIRGNYGIYLRFSPLGVNVFSRVFHEFSILTISSAPRSWAVIWRIENRKPAGSSFLRSLFPPSPDFA